MLELSFPRKWEIDICRIADSPRLEDEAISRAFRNTYGTSSLKDLAAGKQNVAIAVEDITRPARLERVLPCVIRELKAAGVRESVMVPMSQCYGQTWCANSERVFCVIFGY